MSKPFMYKTLLVAGAFLGLGMPNASADTITVDIPNIEAALKLDEPPVSTSFDLNAQFARIDSVTVQIVGRGQYGLMRIIGSDGALEKVFAPPLRVALPNDSSVSPNTWADIVCPPDPSIARNGRQTAIPPIAEGEQVTHVWATGLGHEASDTVWQAQFGPPVSQLPGYFSHLLDGRGELQLQSSDYFIAPGFSTIQILEPSKIEIDRATITVTGVLVPEPDSWILLLAGLLPWLVWMHRNGPLLQGSGQSVVGLDARRGLARAKRNGTREAAKR